ncbi:hypothetical protein ACIGEZ_16130 [Streptomyces sp. NPDC085481]|uniref:hypothetical protein n=1 Tax=Streptomyces sp. NPDC085481 TaxID=3365727 RepID=UPI0037CE4FF9
MVGQRRARRAAAVVVLVAGLVSGCSSSGSAAAEERQQDYCTKLGSWQDIRDDAVAAGGAGDQADLAGYAAVSAAKVIDREGLDRGGSHVLDDTVMAVGGDPVAEGRAASYCDGSGFETLVNGG